MPAPMPIPALVARYDALGKLPHGSFGKALWDFDKRNGYAFPGDPTALNATFGTPHDSTHVISGYDTSPRGEILVSTFTAGMHPINPMTGHILPVIFNGHLGVKFNDVARYTTGGLDPDEFWHAWARGRDMTVDIFAPDWNVWDWVELDLEEVRRPVQRRAGGCFALTAMTSRDFFERAEAHRAELSRAGVLRLGVYGSVARGEADPVSNIDVLVEFDRTPDLYDFAALRDRLVEIFERRVNLATPQALRPRLRARILHEVRYAP